MGCVSIAHGLNTKGRSHMGNICIDGIESDFGEIACVGMDQTRQAS